MFYKLGVLEKIAKFTTKYLSYYLLPFLASYYPCNPVVKWLSMQHNFIQQTMLAACWRLEMVRISDKGPGQPYHKNNSSSPVSGFFFLIKLQLYERLLLKRLSGGFMHQCFALCRFALFNKNQIHVQNDNWQYVYERIIFLLS